MFDSCNDIFFKTHVIPNFGGGTEHCLVRIALLDSSGRTFYAEYLDSNDISEYNIARFTERKEDLSDLLVNNFGFSNVITEKHIKMLGTKEMVETALTQWLDFYDETCNKYLCWCSAYGWYDICVMNDLLWHGDLPSWMYDFKDRVHSAITYEYSLKFKDPMIFVQDMRKDLYEN